jgi:alkylation response protein AidB-like acyl-CoA dehydrogenase
MLAESAEELLSELTPDRFRTLRDAGETQDAELWAQMVELGWTGIPYSEEDGGMGWGLPEVAIVMEALGRRLALAPMLSSVLGTLDPSAGAIDGRILALGWQEAEGRGSLDLQLCGARFADGRLTGSKANVLDGMAAEVYLVTAMDGDGVGLFRVDGAHVHCTPLSRIDHRDAAHIRFEDAPAERVTVTAEAVALAIEHATLALSAEMLGGAQAALDATIAYLKERIQFDVPIGSFQALQHRAVDCYISIELARSAVYAAARNPTPAFVSLAKTRCNEAYLSTAKEAIQLHGGIGMTDEHFIGFHLKRAHVASQSFGTSAQHRDRWGLLRGY